jgi:hypothetical protein
MDDPRVDVFFYGLFMDAGVLRQHGIVPEHPRQAFVDGFALRIGQRATLVPHEGSRAYGMIFALTPAEIDVLYGAPGLELYRAETVLAVTTSGAATPALCYNLREPPRLDERDSEYAHRLRRTLRALQFPSDYVFSIE